MNARVQKAREDAEVSILERITKLAGNPAQDCDARLKENCDAYYVFMTHGLAVEVPSPYSSQYTNKKV